MRAAHLHPNRKSIQRIVTFMAVFETKGTWYTGHRSRKEKGAGKKLEDLVVVFAVVGVLLCRAVNCMAS